MLTHDLRDAARNLRRNRGFAASAIAVLAIGIARQHRPLRSRRCGGVAVLTYRFWQRRFAGQPNALGQTLQLSGA